MPRLNRRGAVVSGHGTVSICDGPGQPVRVVGPGNHACPLDEDRVVYGAANGSLWSVWVYDQRLPFSNIEPKNPAVLDPRDHNWLAAGGGVWGAVGAGGYFGSLPLDAGVRLSLADTDSRGACGRDGTLAITPDTSGLGFTLIAPNGEATSGAPGHAAYRMRVAGPTQAIWPQGGRLTTLNLPTPLHIGPSGEAVWCEVNGQPWVVHYLGDVGLVARPIDSDVGIIIETRPIFFHFDAMTFNGTIRVCYSTTAGEAPDQLIVKDLNLAEAIKIVALPPPPPPPPFREPKPLSAPRTDTGRYYDLAQYIVGKPDLWPRKGPGHHMHQVVRPEGVFFIKFGDLDGAKDGSRYELWPIDKDPRGWIYHIEDASNQETQYFTDPRWWPRMMRIGEQHAFSTASHEAIWFDRVTKQETRRTGFHRRMWLHAVYDSFDWGVELGVAPTIVLVYDPTGGHHAHDRGVEAYYFALGPGWTRWEYHRSDRVFANGPAVFTDASRVHRSDFYQLGGPATQPTITGCVPMGMPSYPPLDGQPIEPEEPPVPEVPNLFAIVQAVWTKYGGENRGAMVNEIAWLGNGGKAEGPWGLSRKSGGANVEQPRTGEKVAHDIVQYGPTDPVTGAFHGYDVFTDTGPSWGQADPHNDPARIWLPAVAPDGVIVLPPPGNGDTQPPPVTGSIDALVQARIAVAVAPLQARIAKLEKGGTPGDGPTLPAGDYSLRSKRTGKLLCNDADRPAQHQVQADNRDSAGEWETWTIEKVGS